MKTQFQKPRLEKQDLQEEEKISEEIEEIEQSEEELARIAFVEKRVTEMAEDRNKAFKYFGMKNSHSNKQEYLTLREYIEESEKRLNGILEKSEEKDDWQANIFDNVTREKFMSIIGRLSAQRMKAQFLNNDGVDGNFAKIITNLYEAAGRGKNGIGKDEKFLYFSLFEAGLKGTVVREEGYYLGKRKVKNHEHFRKTGEIKYKTIYEYEDVYSEVTPLEEFLPGDCSKTEIQEMSECARVQFIDQDTFVSNYAEYKNVKAVAPQAPTKEDQTMFFVSDDTDSVKVIKYYNRITDSHDIVANGILLTKLGNPLPHPHKQLPFTVGRPELLSTRFFYGMSIPMKLSSMQDMNNSVLNMMFDLLYISLMSPIFNGSGADIDVDWMYPKSVIDLPKGTNPNLIREFNINPNNITLAQNALGMIRSRIDTITASGDEQSGISGAGRARTAEEVATAREAAMQIAGMFLRLMEWTEEDRAEQRCQNMLYYYSKPLKSNGKYRKIVIDNVRLLNDEIGRLVINITKEPREKEALNKINLKTEDMSQVIDVTPEMLRNFKYLVKIIPNASLKETEATRTAKELNWYQLTAQNPLVNQKENIKSLAEAYGKDVTKILVQEQTIPGMEGMPPEMASMMQGAGQAPTPQMPSESMIK